ncbi:type III pantothenate kinase [Lutibacter sp. HS1-25]|uniref:type III pantothenate kinase n=1 Tax=Lutibacter sp. HS1-25 TaxID=2485000 RepID=UPI00101369B3|nr:type III pantothenate kinase [Lutibacter sp. HS1-25]RXP45201.1 type III pantothenate kinase [Lutibacter sp. HS1-25]
MNLIIDAGNTRVKIAVYSNSELIHNEIFTPINFLKSTLEIIDKYKCINAIISSVGTVKKNDLIRLKSKINLIELNSETKIPFKNCYLTPKTLGVDRIALIAEAVSKYPNNNVLVIDAGTCVTYDFVNNQGNYLGGAISPGILMRYKALNYFTKKLPLLEAKTDVSLIGNSTESCIHSGVIYGLINEIDSAINSYKEKNNNLTVVLTGGDVNFLANKLKNSIFANPNFLLEGLNTILTYNLN